MVSYCYDDIIEHLEQVDRAIEALSEADKIPVGKINNIENEIMLSLYVLKDNLDKLRIDYERNSDGEIE